MKDGMTPLIKDRKMIAYEMLILVLMISNLTMISAFNVTSIYFVALTSCVNSFLYQ